MLRSKLHACATLFRLIPSLVLLFKFTQADLAQISYQYACVLVGLRIRTHQLQTKYSSCLKNPAKVAILSSHPRSKEEINVFVQQSLIVDIPQAEVLEELVRQPHEFIHPDVFLLVVGDLEEVEDDAVDAHVAEESGKEGNTEI